MNLRYSHNITGRLSLMAGAGPEYIDLENGGYASRWTESARVTLRYKFAHSSMFASYEKYTSTGAGVFAGANVQSAGFGFIRPVGRTWQFFADVAYSHNTQLQNRAAEYLGHDQLQQRFGGRYAPQTPRTVVRLLYRVSLRRGGLREFGALRRRVWEQ